MDSRPEVSSKHINCADGSRPSATGFTLVEILVAMLVLSIVAGAVGAGMVSMIQKNRQANDRLEQVVVGRSATEYARSLPYDSLQDEVTAVNNAGVPTTGGKYLRRIMVQPFGTLQRFTVTISRNPSYNPTTDQ